MGLAMVMVTEFLETTEIMVTMVIMEIMETMATMEITETTATTEIMEIMEITETMATMETTETMEITETMATMEIMETIAPLGNTGEIVEMVFMHNFPNSLKYKQILNKFIVFRASCICNSCYENGAIVPFENGANGLFSHGYSRQGKCREKYQQ